MRPSLLFVLLFLISAGCAEDNLDSLSGGSTKAPPAPQGELVLLQADEDASQMGSAIGGLMGGLLGGISSGHSSGLVGAVSEAPVRRIFITKTRTPPLSLSYSYLLVPTVDSANFAKIRAALVQILTGYEPKTMVPEKEAGSTLPGHLVMLMTRAQIIDAGASGGAARLETKAAAIAPDWNGETKAWDVDAMVEGYEIAASRVVMERAGISPDTKGPLILTASADLRQHDNEAEVFVLDLSAVPEHVIPAWIRLHFQALREGLPPDRSTFERFALELRTFVAKGGTAFGTTAQASEQMTYVIKK